MSIETKMTAAIQESFPVPELLRGLSRICLDDLRYGPMYVTADGDATSESFDPEVTHPFHFSKACGIISRWLDRQNHELFYDYEQDCVVDTSDDYNMGSVFSIDRYTIAKALFHPYLAPYV